MRPARWESLDERTHHRWRALAKAICAEVTVEAGGACDEGLRPGLAVVLVGRTRRARPTSGKEKACIEAGMHSVKITRFRPHRRGRALDIVDRLNADPTDPRHPGAAPAAEQIDTEKVLNRVNPREGRGRVPSGERRQARHRRPDRLRRAPPTVCSRCSSAPASRPGRAAVVVGRSTSWGSPWPDLLIQPGPGAMPRSRSVTRRRATCRPSAAPPTS